MVWRLGFSVEIHSYIRTNSHSLWSMANKILVVDDEPDLNRLISQVFRPQIKAEELSFEFAENGAVALEKLLADPSINVLLTDINMPVMDGLTLLAKIKEHNIFLKAVVISAYGDMQNVRTAMNRGAFDFIIKPFDFADLKTTLIKAVTEVEMIVQGMEAKTHLEKALLEKAEAQQQALINLQEKEKLILNQNEMLEQQVAQRTVEVLSQKEVIEIKNKEILDSITYAKRIQEAILPPEKLVKALLPQSFILYLPKDIVAGDFYWIETAGDRVLIAAADCTGHGVSGALMSMLGVSLLNQIVNEKGITQPAQILNQLHASVIAALKQSQNDTHDGMDIVLCSFDLKKNEVEFAGANRPLWILRNNERIVIAPDKVPIGGLQIERKESYNSHTVSLQKGDSVYLFTDGYADQFGGEHNKKLMSKNFNEMLLSMNGKTMNEQQNFLKNYFDKWKGNSEQVDDVLVIGVEV